jgi:hypothetical protein
MSNDEQLILTVQALVRASLRSFMSGPNGDFVAFFPDHFGVFGTKPVFHLEEIEMKNIHIDACDDPITTHVWSYGDTEDVGLGTANGNSISQVELISGGGFVNILQPYVFDQILNLQPTDNTFFDPQSFLNRFGYRPYKNEYVQIKNKTFEYFMALTTFMQKWSEQYSTTVAFTFMPELFPGMRVELANRGIAVYVESVTHSWDMSSGFQTTASISSPSSTGPNSVPGLPVGRV